MINWIMSKFAHFVIRWVEWRGTQYNIGRSDTDVYMIRYIFLKTYLFKIYVHRFLRSDWDDPHDHPWNFLAYMIEGGYKEHIYRKSDLVSSNDKAVLTGRIEQRASGDWSYKKAEHIHKVELNRGYPVKMKDEAPLTICFIFRKRREWGFWKKTDNYSKHSTVNKWIHWESFTYD